MLERRESKAKGAEESKVFKNNHVDSQSIDINLKDFILVFFNLTHLGRGKRIEMNHQRSLEV